jgi:hypothetical protein
MILGERARDLTIRPELASELLNPYREWLLGPQVPRQLRMFKETS